MGDGDMTTSSTGIQRAKSIAAFLARLPGCQSPLSVAIVSLFDTQDQHKCNKPTHFGLPAPSAWFAFPSRVGRSGGRGRLAHHGAGRGERRRARGGDGRRAAAVLLPLRELCAAHELPDDADDGIVDPSRGVEERAEDEKDRDRREEPSDARQLRRARDRIAVDRRPTTAR